MRRENRKEFKEGLDFKTILYISGSILAIIGFIVTFFIYGSNSEDDTTLGKLNTNIIESYESNIQQASSEFGRTVNEMENNEMENEEDENITKYAVNTSTAEQNTISNKQESNKQTNTTSAKEKQTDSKDKKVEDPKFKSPVKGEITTEFAKDKLVYSNTLQEWITHNGVDIKADKTTVVKASAEGTVKSIKNDPRYGLTVVIEHANGYSTVYSNLLTAEFVVQGEKVKQGQTIGTVGTTATFEIADEAHLHFEILKDSKYLDPELYIKD